MISEICYVLLYKLISSSYYEDFCTNFQISKEVGSQCIPKCASCLMTDRCAFLRKGTGRATLIRIPVGLITNSIAVANNNFISLLRVK